MRRVAALGVAVVAARAVVACSGTDSGLAIHEALDASTHATPNPSPVGASDGGLRALADGGKVSSVDGAVLASDAALPALPAFLAGTNLSGAEFGPGALPGVVNQDYAFPTTQEIDEFAALGFRVLRFPFLWERLQPTLDQPFDATYLAAIQGLVTYATGKGLSALIDPHNYARYRGNVIGASDGGTGPTASDFAAFWGQLAKVFAASPEVIFGVMNEPHDMDTTLWLADANAAISAIRAAGATNVVFVPGNDYTGAHEWVSSDNGTVMLGVVDPLDNYVYEVHEYFDPGSSGQTACGGAAPTDRFTALTQWLSTNHRRAFLGEFAISEDPSCNGLLEPFLAYIDQHRDVYAGWTWWSAGPWWGSYYYSIEPDAGPAYPQVATLVKHL